MSRSWAITRVMDYHSLWRWIKRAVLSISWERSRFVQQESPIEDLQRDTASASQSGVYLGHTNYTSRAYSFLQVRSTAHTSLPEGPNSKLYYTGGKCSRTDQVEASRSRPRAAQLTPVLSGFQNKAGRWIKTARCCRRLTKLSNPWTRLKCSSGA